MLLRLLIYTNLIGIYFKILGGKRAILWSNIVKKFWMTVKHIKIHQGMSRKSLKHAHHTKVLKSSKISSSEFYKITQLDWVFWTVEGSPPSDTFLTILTTSSKFGKAMVLILECISWLLTLTSKEVWRPTCPWTCAPGTAAFKDWMKNQVIY